MERLTDRETAEVLRRNIEALEKVGVKANAFDLRYIRLAEYENEEERKERSFVNYDPDDYYE